ncbi:MAG: Crp/Fnr family transcriptional regulator [Woeseiaceae bacterium]|nr:Crp/Fnr family transcriptional regulator [Woeseiaceae bacterium]
MSCHNIVCPFHEYEPSNGLVAEDGIGCLIIDAVKQVRFSRGAALFAEGQRSSCLYSLTSGLVKITNHTSDGREQIVGLSTPGKLLVGLQSISAHRYEYTAIAETDVYACRIRHRALLRAVRHRGDVAMRLVAALNAQLAHARALMQVMGHKCAAAKIASFIQLVVPHGDESRKRYTLPFSRREIANLLGLSEETVCRQMARMNRRGILYAPRGRIEILDWHGLQAIAEPAVA